MGMKDALAGTQRVATTTAMGRVRLATDEEVAAGVVRNRVASVGQLHDHIVAEIEEALVPAGPLPTFVIGPTNTLETEGLWLETDGAGVPVMLHFDDHDGAAGSNTDGMVAAGVTNPLQHAGLWLRENAQGQIIDLLYYDGNP